MKESIYDRRYQDFSKVMIKNLFELDSMLKETGINYFIAEDTAVRAYVITLKNKKIIKTKPDIFKLKIKDDNEKISNLKDLITESKNFENDRFRPTYQIISKQCGIFDFSVEFNDIEFTHKQLLTNELASLPAQNPSTLTAYLIDNLNYDDRELMNIYRMFTLFNNKQLKPNKGLFNERIKEYNCEETYNKVKNLLKIDNPFS
ncbi:MAG: hypothetical protein WC307_03265 [Candidatus Nanoarchaeia archaeon]|jgi:hypothetical protein